MNNYTEHLSEEIATDNFTRLVIKAWFKENGDKVIVKPALIRIVIDLLKARVKSMT